MGEMSMKKTLAILVAFCLTFGLTTSLAAGSPAAVVERCTQVMGQAGSFAAKGTLTVGVEGLLNTAVYDALSAEVFLEPLKARLLFEAMGAKMEAYVEEADGKLYLYAKTGARWDTQILGGEDLLLAEFDPAVLAEGLQVEKTELQDGKKAWRLSADINLREWLDEADIEEMAGLALGLPAMGVFPPYEPVNLQIAAFVEVETGYLARVEIDLSQFASAILTMLTPSQPGMESEPLAAEIVISLGFFDWNAVKDFEIPAQAKAQ